MAENAFVNLTLAMKHTPVLDPPNFDEQFSVETDVCDLAIGTVLMQERYPVTSKALGPPHCHMPIYDKEFIVLIMAVESW